VVHEEPYSFVPSVYLISLHLKPRVVKKGVLHRKWQIGCIKY